MSATVVAICSTNRRTKHSKVTPDDKREGMLIVKQYTILNR